MKNNKTKTVSLSSLFEKPNRLYEKFHHKTKNKMGISQLSFTEWPEEWKKIYYKGYSRFPNISLPQPKKIQNQSLLDALSKRTSERTFSTKPVSLLNLSTLLYYSTGLKDLNNKKNTSRFYPSAGGRYPIETYILSQNTELENGVYHYYVKENSLEKLFPLPPIALKKCFIDTWMSEAPCIVLFTAFFKRNTFKYSDRGYRQILNEAGHIGQNIYLLSSALNLACTTNDGFLDDNLNKLLEVDGVKESVIYTMAIGEKKYP